MSYENGETIVKGSCQWRDGPLLLTADEFHYRQQSDTLTAIGNVVFTRGDGRLLADWLEYNRTDGSFHAKNLRLGRYPYYIEGESAEGSKGEVVVHNATVSYTEPGRWKPSVKAQTIVYSPGHELRMVRSFVGLHSVEFFPVAKFRQVLNEPMLASYLSLDAGYRSNLGGILDLGLHLPIFEGAKVGGDLGLYTKRGFMFGPSGTYASADGGWTDDLESGFIRDHGNRMTDDLGRPIRSDRGFLDWHHHQDLAENLTLTGDINWWRDSYVVRDFRPKEFTPVESPDNTLEAVYTAQNAFASVFARFQPNSWEAVQERLPEARFDLLPTAIGAGFVERFNASAVSLIERPPGGGQELKSDRFDAFYGLSRPIAPAQWLTLTPVAGARITDYIDTTGAATSGGYVRTLGEVGFDAVLRGSGTFAYQKPAWGIDGLRHLVTPTLSYRYIPEADSGQSKIPAIDRQAFTTYLTPLDLGDIRSIDDLHPLNTLRLGVSNILQTRDPTYGSRNLAALNIADDFNFRRTQAEPDFSDLHTELALTPANWIEWDVAEIFSARNLGLREFDSGLVLKDGNAWSLQVAVDFLRHEDNDYLLNGRVRLTEEFDALLLLEYGARQRRFNQAAVGLVQNLANTWRIRYMFTHNGGPNREGRFGFTVELDVFRY